MNEPLTSNPLLALSDARLDWAMRCECYCSACVAMDAAIRKLLAADETTPAPTEMAVHKAIKRALQEAGVNSEVLLGMCIEVGIETYRVAVNGSEQLKVTK